MKVIESAAFAVIVATVIGFVTWRSGADWILGAPVSFLAAFVMAYLKPRNTSTRRASRRR